MVPTGDELTLFEAVGRAGPDLLLLCRSSPVGDVWRDLIDAWHRLQQAVSARCPFLSMQEDEVNDCARRGHSQALAHGCRDRRRNGRAARRADRPGWAWRVRRVVAVGARTRRGPRVGA